MFTLEIVDSIIISDFYYMMRVLYIEGEISVAKVGIVKIFKFLGVHAPRPPNTDEKHSKYKLMYYCPGSGTLRHGSATSRISAVSAHEYHLHIFSTSARDRAPYVLY